MIGILCCGGTGSRMGLSTKRITNKHLLQVYDKPMVLYPLSTMVEAGVSDAIIVTGDSYAGDFVKLLGDGHEFGLESLRFAFQYKPDGIVGAIREARKSSKEDALVILGDNMFGNPNDVKNMVMRFHEEPNALAWCLLKEVADPERFGVAEIRDDRIVSIEEKPSAPKSFFAIVGAYCFNAHLLEEVETLKPSGRGELEVTDLLKIAMEERALGFSFMDGFWSDMGTPETLTKAACHVWERNFKGEW